ncbi:SulP family inorganic anion transporter [Marinobacterium rhizophilum]|uniref:SulP family inorganic anion transporter n=1 Tax=Marinobacterium rhizophilum TaxID=420402 RepID=A0ABY5HFK7_9GAMM|nr:SulP family inorganic anion transporter [Marinobacterium rhizophilum]UTW11143.1 SulP family inorganic anion transporter [Marinobacterium rhizophilum]
MARAFKTRPSATLWTRLFPFLLWGRLLNRETLRCDFFAGLTNAVIVLPQGVAYALIAGMPPQYGLYAAIVPAIIAALFGSSFHLISGPTAALSIVVFTTISPLAEPGSAAFIQLALTLTLLAGLFQLGLALARMGVLVNFVSHSVVVGFTAGAAVVIASSQMKNLLGVSVKSDGTFISTWAGVLEHLPDTNVYSLAVALCTLFSCLVIKKLLPKWPNMLLAMIIGSLLAALLGAEAHNIALVGSIPASLPPLSVPDFSPALLHQLGSGALAIGLLGLVEAVSIARSVASRSHQTISGNQEFMGQALSNIVGSFFSCYASSGSFTRTGVNYASGARSPLAAVFAAISLAIIVLLLSDLTAYVPIPSMAGILLVVSWNLIDFHHIGGILKAGRSEASVLIITFLATLVMAMEFAIYIGVMLSLVFYLKTTSKPKIVQVLPDPTSPTPFFVSNEGRNLPECPQLRIIRIEGSLFFGAVNYVKEYLQDIPEDNLLVVGNGMNFIDIAGAELLVHEARRRRAAGGTLYLSNLKDRVLQYLDKNGHIEEIGAENIFISKGTAIARIYERLDRPTCDSCSTRIFSECRRDYPDPS